MSRGVNVSGRALAALLTVLVAACTATPTAVPPMSSADLAACQGIPAPRPSPPDFGPDLAYLDRIIGPLSAEVMARAPEFNGIGINSVDHVIDILAAHPTKAMCDDLHRRYGPWIRVKQGEVEPLGGSSPSGRE